MDTAKDQNSEFNNEHEGANEHGNPPNDDNSIEDFEQSLNQEQNSDSLEEHLKDAQDKYVRLYSDFDNFRKRTQKEKADLINYASGDVIKDFLDVLDDFERAIQSNQNNTDIDSLKSGFELLYHKFDSALKQKGLTEMSCQGDSFSSDFHEAITNIPAGDDMKGKIVDVVLKGYFIKERVLRYAKVVVGE